MTRNKFTSAHQTLLFPLFSLSLFLSLSLSLSLACVYIHLTSGVMMMKHKWNGSSGKIIRLCTQSISCLFYFFFFFFFFLLLSLFSFIFSSPPWYHFLHSGSVSMNNQWKREKEAKIFLFTWNTFSLLLLLLEPRMEDKEREKEKEREREIKTLQTNKTKCVHIWIKMLLCGN